MANSAGYPPTRLAAGEPAEHPAAQQQLPADIPVPSFYLTGRQPLSPGAILLAVVAAAMAPSLVLYLLGQHAANQAAGRSGADDPDQVDVIVMGEPAAAASRAHTGDHVSPVHPTIIVHLPRFGSQVGMIPNTPAGHLLFAWLGAFNQASHPALANALPSVALNPAIAAQLELRQLTGGLSLLSAREVEPGIMVFRLRDQTPSATEILGTLQVSPNSSPATIATLSLHAVSPASQTVNTGAAPNGPGSPR